MLHKKYKFVTKEFLDIRTKKKNVTICISSLNNNITIPHPITEFINANYYVNTRSINSLLHPSRIICRFLNFILMKIDEKNPYFMQLSISGLQGLKLIHGSKYITHLSSKNLKRNTVLQYDNVLNKFYIFLSKYQYIDEGIYNNLIENQSLFADLHLQTIYPPRNKATAKHKLKDFGKNRYALIEKFITTSSQVAPEITLALCLQFFGGLRRGEIVNLTYNDIEVHKNHSMSVNIKDNRSLLFPHLKDTSNEFPKRLNYLSPHLCKQIILNTPILWDSYNLHIKMNSNKSSSHRPLFINKYNDPMSSKVYDRRFHRVKKAFLENLKIQGMYEDYNLLTDTTWASHIGRGNFTNILFDMGLTATQIAIARGDSNVNSALDYVDEKTTYNIIQQNLEVLSKLSL